MKVLTLTQPWASLIAAGAKRLETRSWSTPYRGPIAIHATRAFPLEAQSLCYAHPFTEALLAGGYKTLADLPRGAIVCTATLAEIEPADSSTCTAWLHRGPDHERVFGYFLTGRFAWLLSDVQRLVPPVEHRGGQGLRDLPADVADRCRAAAACRCSMDGCAAPAVGLADSLACAHDRNCPVRVQAFVDGPPAGCCRSTA